MVVEEITPYGSGQSKGEQVEQMFDSIAPAYDFMNRAMTLGIDRLWRRKAVNLIGKQASPPATILDIATGTGDLAIALARKLPQARIIGADLSAGMLAIGRDKAAKAGLSDRISFREADCLHLHFADNEFDAITAAFGVRNFADIPAGLKEMARVLKPGGLLCIIELSTPVNPLVKPFYRLYTRGIIPLVGRLVSHDSRAYSYLPESIAAVPQRQAMCALMAEADLTECKFRPLTLGVCTIYTARKD